MSGFVYLMKNGDLYKLGCATNLKVEASKMKPGEIISSFKTNDPKSFEVRLLRLYKKKRIPDTNYFRLSESEVDSSKINNLDPQRNFVDVNPEVNIMNTNTTNPFLVYLFENKPIESKKNISMFPLYNIEKLNEIDDYCNLNLQKLDFLKNIKPLI